MEGTPGFTLITLSFVLRLHDQQVLCVSLFCTYMAAHEWVKTKRKSVFPTIITGLANCFPVEEGIAVILVTA